MKRIGKWIAAPFRVVAWLLGALLYGIGSGFQWAGAALLGWVWTRELSDGWDRHGDSHG